MNPRNSLALHLHGTMLLWKQWVRIVPVDMHVACALPSLSLGCQSKCMSMFVTGTSV